MYGQPSARGGGESSKRRYKPPHQNRSKERSQSGKDSKELLKKVGRAVEEARLKIVGTGESVTSWKVSQEALLMLKIDSWSSLGFSMQEVPNLHRLFVTEGKINAFIHCFIGVRRITSLYDLEVAICENEGVEKFEELELGPLLRHPLILHYFSVNSDVTEVFKITSEEIFSFLWKFSYKKKYKDIRAEEFLDFIAKKQSVESKEKLGIRIQSLMMHISAIRKAGYSENATIKKSVKALKSESDKKCRKHPPLSSLKKQLKEPSNSTQSIESFLSEKTDLCGGHKRSFVSSSSDDENSDDCTSYDERIGNSTGDQNNLLSQLGLNDEICGQPSHAGGNPSHNEGSGLSKKKGKSGNLRCTMSAPSESFKEKNETENLDCTMSTPSLKRYEVDIDIDFHAVQYYNKTEEDSNVNEADLAIANNSKRTRLSRKNISSMRSFITTWNEACREHTVPEVWSSSCSRLYFTSATLPMIYLRA